MSAGDRHHLGDGDPVEPVHEVDEIHEPDAAEDEKSLLHHEGNGIRQHPQAARRHDGRDRPDLQNEPQAGGQGTDVVDGADDA